MEVLHQPEDIIEQRYRILYILGKGGIGTTYAAENLQTGERVALKVVSLRRTDDPKVLELFEREARILSQLNHPGIPRYLDYFQVKKRRNSYFYLAQQLVEGKSLAEWVENGWHPQEVEVWHIANQILDILVYLQQFTPPVIHRDIKPQNILRRSDGKVFLVDFGAVQDVYHGTLTGGSTVAGTYGYMAPEQFRGKTVLATDLYGLGATLIFLLTQKSPADLPKRKLKIDFRPQVRVTKRFADWLERMIEPVAEDRFRSAGEALMVWQGKNELTSSSQKIDQSLDKQLILKNDEEKKIEIITTQFIQFFKFLNITAKISLENDCLMILLESDKLPDQQVSVAFIHRQLINCGIESIQTVQICGQKRRGNHKVWKYKFNLVFPEKMSLPTGYILRRINFKKDIFKKVNLVCFNSSVINITAITARNVIGLTLVIFLLDLLCVLIFYSDKILTHISFFKDMFMGFLALSILMGIVGVLAFLWLYIINFIGQRFVTSWIIEKNKSLVGFIELSKINGNSYIRRLFVSPKCRRKGLGSALIKHLIKNSNKPVYLHCSPELVSFYTRLGFIQSGTLSWLVTMVYFRKQ